MGTFPGSEWFAHHGLPCNTHLKNLEVRGCGYEPEAVSRGREARHVNIELPVPQVWTKLGQLRATRRSQSGAYPNGLRQDDLKSRTD